MDYNFAGYLIFALVTSITPGPNNFMLFSYGKAYGFKESIALMLGIFLGFSTMLYITGYGMGNIVAQNAIIGLTLKIIGSLWLLYLAFMVSKISAEETNNNLNKIGFTQAYLLQFINPKAWIMAINGAAVFMPKFSNIHVNVFLFTIIFGIVGIPCMFVWTMLGDSISKIIKSQKANKILGYIVFVLMLTSVVSIWI